MTVTFELPDLYSPIELNHFLGFFNSWIRIRIREDFYYADPCGSGSATLHYCLLYNVLYLYCTYKSTVFKFVQAISL